MAFDNITIPYTQDSSEVEIMKDVFFDEDLVPHNYAGSGAKLSLTVKKANISGNEDVIIAKHNNSIVSSGVGENCETTDIDVSSNETQVPIVFGVDPSHIGDVGTGVTERITIRATDEDGHSVDASTFTVSIVNSPPEIIEFTFYKEAACNNLLDGEYLQNPGDSAYLSLKLTDTYQTFQPDEIEGLVIAVGNTVGYNDPPITSEYFELGKATFTVINNVIHRVQRITVKDGNLASQQFVAIFTNNGGLSDTASITLNVGTQPAPTLVMGGYGIAGLTEIPENAMDENGNHPNTQYFLPFTMEANTANEMVTLEFTANGATGQNVCPVQDTWWIQEGENVIDSGEEVGPTITNGAVFFVLTEGWSGNATFTLTATGVENGGTSSISKTLSITPQTSPPISLS